MSTTCESCRLPHRADKLCARARVYVFIILNLRAFGTDNC